MNKKIIIVLMFFVMGSHSFASEEIKLPELPTMTVENTINDDEISFWQKIKNFFGFGDVENKELNKTEIIPTTIDLNIAPNENTLGSEINLEETTTKTQDLQENLVLDDSQNMPNKENTQPDNAIDLPMNGDSSENKIPTLETKDDKKNVIEDLKLPEGFDDDIDVKKNVKEPDDTKDVNASNAINKEANTLSEEITELQIPTLDGVDNKEGKTSEVNSNISPTDESNKEISSDAILIPTLDGVDNKEGKTSEVTNDKTTILIPSAQTSVVNQNIDSKAENKDSIESLVPTYASETDSKTDDSKLLKYKAEFKSNKNELKKITQISDKELIKNKKSLENDPVQIAFIKNEAQVLTLPNEEIVLGNITEDTEYELMDIRTYIDMFWNKYNQFLREPKTEELKKYIKNYNENFNENY